MSLRCLAMIVAFVCAAPASGNTRPLQEDDFDPALLRVEESLYLGQTVPDVSVVTETGTKQLSALVAKQPTILVLAYYTCGHSCPMTVQNLSSKLATIQLPDHRVIVLSFDANDTLETMRHVKSTLPEVPAGWTFGLLSHEDSARLTRAVGFKFFFSERDQIFVHPTLLTFLSPEGEVMRYLYGTEHRARDIGFTLIESRNRAPRLGEIIDMLKVTCFQFDATRSRYVLHPALIFGSAGLGILGLTGLAALVYKPKPEGGHG